jgi:2-iminobutanoate/2-iminopropanoate deaminase
MENLKAKLQAAGYNFSDVVQSNVYLASMALFSEFNDEYAKYFDKVFPTRATVGIELMPGALLEIAVVAYKDLLFARAIIDIIYNYVCDYIFL